MQAETRLICALALALALALTLALIDSVHERDQTAIAVRRG